MRTPGVLLLVHHRHGQWRPVPVVELRVVHHASPRASACPHPGEVARPERVTRTRVRDAEVRAAVPRRDPDALTLIERAEDYRVEHNTERPHEAIAWNRPLEVHLGLADPTTPTLKQKKSCQLLDAGHTVEQVELATLEYVWWWNNQRLHGELDMRTPAAVEADYYAGLDTPVGTPVSQAAR